MGWAVDIIDPKSLPLSKYISFVSVNVDLKLECILEIIIFKAQFLQ